MNDWLEEFKGVLSQEAAAIRTYAESLEKNETRKNLIQAVELIHSSLKGGGKIVVMGIGKSGKIAQKIASTLTSTGSFSVFVHPSEALHGDLGIVRPGDVVLALSHSGNSDELTQIFPSLDRLKVPIIAITANGGSKLAQRALYWIDTQVKTEACPYNLAPTTSTTLALALGDALAIALMKLSDFKPDAFALNHPGGALGRKLTLKVKDIMHTGAAIGRVAENAPMDTIIELATEKHLGAVCVLAETRLLGIVTDGDLRRALRLKEKFFEFRAQDIMTKDPVTVSPEELACDALKKMENRKSQISVLPVVDQNNEFVGLIRLHDVVQSL